MKKYILFLFVLLGEISTAKAQVITVDTSPTAAALASYLAGSGITISGATLNCGAGGSGTFTSSGTIIEMPAGVVLTSGLATNIIGPNNLTGVSTSLSLPGDADLDLIVTLGTNDACALEFDVIPINDTLFFEYQFGSDEYLEFVFTINDAFGLYVSGPGIVGSQNIAIVPGSSPALPVSIFNVNDATSPAFYIDNGTGTTPLVDNTMQYDGLTTLLPAKIAVTPCETYHLKLVVADASDFILDSGVFIKAGSLTSYGIVLSQSTEYGGSAFTAAIEGCNNGVVNFNIQPPKPTDQTIYFSIEGTATNGLDYPLTPDSIIIPANDTTYQLVFPAFADGISEGTEEIIIKLFTFCGTDTTYYDSISVDLMDFVIAEAMGGDVNVCEGATINLTASGGTNYQWFPPTYLDDPTIATPVCSPPSSLTFVDYVVQVGVGPVGICSDTTVLRVNILPPPIANAGNNDSICINASITLSGAGGGTYTWLGTDIDAGSATANPTVSPLVSTNYIMNISSAVGCTDADTVRIIVMPLPLVSAGTDKIICPGFSTPINGTLGLAGYSWTPNSTLSCSNCPTPVAAPTATTTYVLTGSSPFGCIQNDNMTVTVSNPTANAGPNIDGCNGDAIPVTTPPLPGYSYSWSPASLVSPPNVSNPSLILQNTDTVDVVTTYTLTITDANGCIETDNVNATVYHNPIINAGVYTIINIGESYTFNPTSDDPATSYLWSPYDPTFMVNQATANATVTPPVTTTYTLAATNSEGCRNIDTMSLYVYVPPFVAVPNAFSPDNDQINDRLLVYFYGINKIHEYKIFNRWGQKVFEQNNLEVGGTNGGLWNAQWDGTLDGKLQPMDTYVYYITATTVNNEQKQYTGNITLIK